ncbi:transcriptional regulator [Sphingomonas sp. UV9]|uniref:transcriptional regulator n=1 Tax=Sphingomonas sp. UV9 TaxID=1851410 RepID=UPI000FFBEDF7|nr:transcriptional regulator [Sphingomonas sp. UV9]RXD03625.1 transcriptional regulator [Sphingomonas sp. UV9]
MLAFLDFEASSLGKASYPIEVAWVFEDGASESHLIRPAPDWTDWNPAAEAIHQIPRTVLEAEGEDHRVVAARMVAVLTGHDLLASAPSWDGKWLSALLRAGGQPKRVLRLRDSDEAQLEAARVCLVGVEPGAVREALAREVVGEVSQRRNGRVPEHRALADAEGELAQWLEVRVEAQRRARGFLAAD